MVCHSADVAGLLADVERDGYADVYLARPGRPPRDASAPIGRSYTLRLPDPLRARAEARASADGASLADVVCAALDAYVD